MNMDHSTIIVILFYLLFFIIVRFSLVLLCLVGTTQLVAVELLAQANLFILFSYVGLDIGWSTVSASTWNLRVKPIC